MKDKTKFIAAVCVTGILTSVFLFTILVLPGPAILLKLERSERLAISSAWMDGVIGLFTIWGLYWAATEFAEFTIKPKLELFPGEGEGEHILDGLEKFSIMQSPPFHVPGRYTKPAIGGPIRHPHIACGLFLENKTSRAGRYVHIVIRFYTTPAPIHCEFRYRSLWPTNSPLLIEGKQNANNGHFTVSAQLPENLVVYQTPVFVGELQVVWDSKLANDSFPKNAVLDYDIYTLDGDSHEKLPPLSIEWERDDKQ